MKYKAQVKFKEQGLINIEDLILKLKSTKDKKEILLIIEEIKGELLENLEIVILD